MKSADTIAAEAGLIDEPTDLLYDARRAISRVKSAAQRALITALEAENAALRAKLDVANRILNDIAGTVAPSRRLSAGWEHMPDVTAGAVRPAGPLAHNPFRSFRAPGFMGMARS